VSSNRDCCLTLRQSMAAIFWDFIDSGKSGKSIDLGSLRVVDFLPISNSVEADFSEVGFLFPPHLRLADLVPHFRRKLISPRSGLISAGSYPSHLGLAEVVLHFRRKLEILRGAGQLCCGAAKPWPAA